MQFIQPKILQNFQRNNFCTRNTISDTQMTCSLFDVMVHAGNNNLFESKNILVLFQINCISDLCNSVCNFNNCDLRSAGDNFQKRL